MRRDPIHNHRWAIDQAQCYQKRLKKAARGNRWGFKSSKIVVMEFYSASVDWSLKIAWTCIQGQILSSLERTKRVYKAAIYTRNCDWNREGPKRSGKKSGKAQLALVLA